MLGKQTIKDSCSIHHVLMAIYDCSAQQYSISELPESEASFVSEGAVRFLGYTAWVTTDRLICAPFVVRVLRSKQLEELFCRHIAVHAFC